MAVEASSRGKVLIVDDSELVLENVRLTLENAGYAVVASSSPFGVSALVAKERPELVLLDVGMPALSGSKLAELVRGSGVDVAVILFSDRSIEELEEARRMCRADGWLQKTGDEAELVRHVERWVTHTRRRRAPTKS
jgi:DNA-binding response OmpR family regulator